MKTQSQDQADAASLSSSVIEIIPQEHSAISKFIFGAPPRPIPRAPQTTPEANANILSYVTWSWLSDLMYTGYNRALEFNDLFVPAENEKLEHRMAIYRKKAQQYKEQGSHSPHWKAIAFVVRKDIIIGFSLYIVASVCEIGMAVIANKLILLIEDIYRGQTHYGEAVGYAIGQTAILLAFLMFYVVGQYHQNRLQESVRIVADTAIHDKTLRLSAYGHAQYSSATITSLVTTDVTRLALASRFLLFPLICPLIIGAIIGLLIHYLGVSALAGVGVILVGLVVTGGSGRLVNNYRKQSLEHSDKRVGTVRETISNMRTLKLYGWENSFVSVISAARKLEESLISKIAQINVSVSALTEVMPYFAGLVTFSIMSSIGKGLQPAAIFPSLTLFNMVAPQTQQFTQGVVYVADAYTCFERVELFLDADESHNSVEEVEGADYAVKFENTSVKWLKDIVGAAQLTLVQRLKTAFGLKKTSSQVPVTEVSSVVPNATELPGLENINLTIRKGEFIVVVGAIGSGKSNLLNAISGNMAKLNGSLSVDGGITAILNSWCLSATVRDNILFGKEFDAQHYSDVIRACALMSDIQMFESGDQTEVGENGITLSGGQKARLALARGVYGARDIILLDDVLSAVDSKVGRNIMENCITGLLSGTTRIMTTHNPKHLAYADRVIFMVDGKLKIGTLEELQEDSEFVEFMDKDIPQGKSLGEEETDTDEKEKDTQESKTKEKLMLEETRARGKANFKVLKSYILHSGSHPYLNCGIIVLLVMVVGTLNAMQSVFLNWWTADKFLKGNDFYIGIYAAIVIGFCALQILFLLIVSTMIFRATSSLHNDAVANIYRAPLSFFDTNPIGRVLNRFTNDLTILDTKWFFTLSGFIPELAICVGQYVMLFVYVPWSILCAIPLLAIGFIAASYYRYSSREINRIHSLLRGKQMSSITENIDGTDVITGYGREGYFRSRVYVNSDSAFIGSVLNVASIYWFGIRVIFGFLPTNFCVVMLCIFHVFNVSPSTVGMLLSLLPSACISFLQTMIVATETEKNINSIERLHEYAYSVPQEAPQEIPATKPQDSWPARGQIVFEDVSLRYREGLPLVLDGLNLSINAGEKIGICGRTGAGKSSLLACLFRLNEVENGSIFIDEVNTRTIGLSSLRGALSIIPQESVLFKGTVRSNLDPFEQYTDVELWDALRRSGASFQLDGEVEDNGANFSLGERQLLMLSRALVRSSKILALDEATANVDHKTDSAIQTILSKEFKDCTVLCIAHRLQTILGYDRIVVMDRGRVAEVGAPIELWRQNGIFASLCSEAGIDVSDIRNAQEESL